MITGAREGLAARYQSWPNEELLRAVALEPDEYSAEALELIENELARRNCSAPQRQELLKAAIRESDEEARSLTGVWGLLLLMVLFVGVVSAAALVKAGSHVFLGVHHDPWFFTVTKICQGVFGLVVCALLIARDPSAPRHAAAWFLVTMSLSVAGFLYSYLFTDQATSYPLSTFFIACVLWLHYLSVSKRVKVTCSSKGHGSIETSALSPGVALDS